jgi:hypothetical protein
MFEGEMKGTEKESASRETINLSSAHREIVMTDVEGQSQHVK